MFNYFKVPKLNCRISFWQGEEHGNKSTPRDQQMSISDFLTVVGLILQYCPLEANSLELGRSDRHQ